MSSTKIAIWLLAACLGCDDSSSPRFPPSLEIIVVHDDDPDPSDATTVANDHDLVRPEDVEDASPSSGSPEAEDTGDEQSAAAGDAGRGWDAEDTEEGIDGEDAAEAADYLEPTGTEDAFESEDWAPDVSQPEKDTQDAGESNDGTEDAVSETSPPQAVDSLPGSVLFGNPDSLAAAWATGNTDAPASDLQAIHELAEIPTAAWFGAWNSDLANEVGSYVSLADSAGAVPVLVAYRLSWCNTFAADGSDEAAYLSWIEEMAEGVGGRKAAVILEPGALTPSNLGCLTEADKGKQLALIQSAVSLLKQQGAWVYIDTGRPKLDELPAVAEHLVAAGVGSADGFAVNVAGFETSDDSIVLGQALAGIIAGHGFDTHFVIDTGRNGNGPEGGPDSWCNPPGRALGHIPTTVTGALLVDAFLWVKPPGESDGECNGGPAAGKFWTAYALELIANPVWW